MTDNNGKAHGIKLHAFTFQDSGVTIQYRKLSPNTILEFNKVFDDSNPEPKPPMQKVTTPDGEREEANEAHPDYIEAKKKYNMQKQESINGLIIKRSVVIELSDDDRLSVEELKKFWRDEYKKELTGSDKEIFIKHIACSTTDDLRDLTRVVSRRSFPTEDAISENIKSL